MLISMQNEEQNEDKLGKNEARVRNQILAGPCKMWKQFSTNSKTANSLGNPNSNSGNHKLDSTGFGDDK